MAIESSLGLKIRSGVIYTDKTWELGEPKGMCRTALISELALFLRSIYMYRITTNEVE